MCGRKEKGGPAHVNLEESTCMGSNAHAKNPSPLLAVPHHRGTQKKLLQVSCKPREGDVPHALEPPRSPRIPKGKTRWKDLKKIRSGVDDRIRAGGPDP